MMKKALMVVFVLTSVLVSVLPVSAGIALSQFIGQRVVFLPGDEYIQKLYGYLECYRDSALNERILYDELVGKTAVIAAVDESSQSLELRCDDDQKVYIKVESFYENVPYLGFFSDLEEAKELIGQTIWNTRGFQLLDRKSQEDEMYLPELSRCRLVGVEWGIDQNDPLSFIIQTPNGGQAIWRGSMNGINSIPIAKTLLFKNDWYLPLTQEAGAADRAAIDKIAKDLSGWKSVIADTYEDGVKYLTPKPGTFELIGQTVDGYLFEGRVMDVWNGNKELSIFIGATICSDRADYDISDGSGPMKLYLDEVNPGVSKNYPVYFMTVVDKSQCPLRILAYRVTIGRYGIVAIDLIVKNTSKKEIAAFTGSFLMYDKMGNPVTWGGGTNEFRVLFQDAPIPALSLSTEVGTWELTLYGSTRTIKPYIREIKFADGSSWKWK